MVACKHEHFYFSKTSQSNNKMYKQVRWQVHSVQQKEYVTFWIRYAAIEFRINVTDLQSFYLIEKSNYGKDFFLFDLLNQYFFCWIYFLQTLFFQTNNTKVFFSATDSIWFFIVLGNWSVLNEPLLMTFN